ncbi:MAG: corrinoid protein [Candidatus Aminicenantes bacterium]|nr:corrinoid protein [Candidatus Aminicenantes bacterium]
MSDHPLYGRMAQALIDGDREAAARLAAEGLAAGLLVHDIIALGFVPGLHKVGELWECGDYFLPELIQSAEGMKAAMAALRPALEAAGPSAGLAKGKAVIGTIEGDIHDIGKNLVASLLSANGFDVLDLGADVKLDRFIDAAVEAGADLICLSSLLTTTMLAQRRFMDRLRERGLRDRFKVLVGGAPVTAKWAAEIGADGYGENAVAAVRAAESVLGGK